MTSIIHILDQRRLIGPGGSTMAGVMHFYYTGTSVYAPIYADSSMSTPMTNPVVVGAGQIIPSIYLDEAVTYKRRIVYSDGTVDEEDPLGNLFGNSELGVPVGTVLDFSGPVLPDNYQYCAGQELSRATYSALFAVIGTTYGSGNGTTTFNVPDYRGRVLAGKDNMNGTAAGRLTQVDGTTLGAAGGTDTVTLTSSQIPAHTHPITDPGHFHTTTVHRAGANGGDGGGARWNVQTVTDYGPFGVASDTKTTGITVNANTGGDGAHSNTQPTAVTNKIIKVLPSSALSLLGQIPDITTLTNLSNQTEDNAASAAASATSATASQNSAARSASSAALSVSSVLAAIGAQNILSSNPSSLPYEVIGISGGIGTGSGGTPGTYVGGVSGGPPGFQWIYTIASTGKIDSYTIVNPGLGTTAAAPTLSFPKGGITGATIPTASMYTIPVNRIFLAPSADNANILAWGNNAGSLASAPFGGTQLVLYTKTGIDNAITSFDNEFYNGSLAYGADYWTLYYNTGDTTKGILANTTDTYLQGLGIVQTIQPNTTGSIINSVIQDLGRDITGQYIIASAIVKISAASTWLVPTVFTRSVGGSITNLIGSTSSYEQLTTNYRLYTIRGQVGTSPTGQEQVFIGTTSAGDFTGAEIGGFSIAVNSVAFTMYSQLRRFGWNRDMDRARVVSRLKAAENSLPQRGQLPSFLYNGGLANSAEGWIGYGTSTNAQDAITTDSVFLSYGVERTFQATVAGSLKGFKQQDAGVDLAGLYVQFGGIVKVSTAGNWAALSALVGTSPGAGGASLISSTSGYVQIDATHRFYWVRGQVPSTVGSRYVLLGSFFDTNMAGGEFGGFTGAWRKTPFLNLSDVDHLGNVTVSDHYRIQARLTSLEQVLPATTAIDLYIPPDLWITSGKTSSFYVQNANANIINNPVWTMAISGSTGSGSTVVSTLDASREKLTLDPSALSGTTTFEARSFSGDQTLRKQVVTNVHVCPTGQSGTVKVLCIGDSIFNFGMASKILAKLQARTGLNCTLVGTSGAGGTGEIRSGRRFTDYIYKTTDQMSPVSIGSEAAYLAMTDTQKLAYNPFIRASTGGDDPSVVFNGYVFDPASYVSRFAGATSPLDVEVPTHVVIGLGRNDISLVSGRTTAQILADLQDGMRVMYTQIRAAWPSAKISFLWHVTSNTAAGNAEWPTYLSVYAREFMKFVKSKSDTKLAFLPGYLHCPRDGFLYTSSVQSTDPDTGMMSVTLSDYYHYQQGPYLDKEADLVMSWIGASQAGV